MSVCPECQSAVPDNNRFCGRCGGSLDPTSSTPTQTSVPGVSTNANTATGRLSQGAGRLGSSDGLIDCRFLPGTMLERRYRIVGLLGRGGMGEVYRADDLKLGQPVALKFLPEDLERHESRLTRFLNEVKIARQVSHANVCRVYDVGEFEGQHYLSMEYVDGEDLASLLRRIGRLPHDKAVEIARQICAGLAAAHARGIAHRDLKPANVMIDGRGHVRITDFGLAGLAKTIEGAEVRAGTPDYMAPEQFSGKEVTLKSDLYALGLVLYELFTGKRAYRADSLAELAELRAQTPPASPSSLVDNLDPVVERVILRCLEKDPGRRPASALAVAAALPGADPLAAALAAGETPSPEIVAGAGTEGGLKSWVALLLLVASFVAFAGALVLAQGTRLVHRAPLSQPPAALAVTARQILVGLGHTAPPADRVFGFVYDRNHLTKIQREDQSAERWDTLATVLPAPVQFWYRESPVPLVPMGLYGRVSLANPPLRVSGMTSMMLDADGRLTSFRAVPPERDDSAGPELETDWSLLFERAGLELATFREVDPQWNPLVDCDRRAAWEGTYPGQADIPIRVEAGSYRGLPVYYRVIAPWTEPWRTAGAEGGPVGRRFAQTAMLSLVAVVLIGAIVLARRNLRFGRVDRRGAYRIALYLLFVVLTSWVVTHHPVFDLSLVGLLLVAAQSALFVAVVSWLVYVALEPYARRLWPHVLISWTRLLSGRLNDPLVGRDLLLGYLAGGVLAVIALFSLAVPEWLGRPPAEPITNAIAYRALDGARHTVGLFFNMQMSATFVPIGLLFLIVMLRVLLRRPRAAVGGTWLIMTLIAGIGGGGTLFDWFFAGLLYAVVLALLLRGGLLATILAFFYADLFLHLPLTLDFSTWYASWAMGVLILASFLPLYGFYTSLAGKPLFHDVLQEA